MGSNTGYLLKSFLLCQMTPKMILLLKNQEELFGYPCKHAPRVLHLAEGVKLRGKFKD
jgi:hypothetical protein